MSANQQAIAFALLLSVWAVAAEAKDVSAQQAGVEYARQEVAKADTQHQADLKEVADSEKLLEQRRKAYEQQTKKLAEDRQKAELSKKHLLEANAKFDKAQAILDQAWKK